MTIDRRSVLLGAAGAAALTSGAKGKVSSGKMPAYKRIATEEGFTTPEVIEAQTRYLATATDEPGMAGAQVPGTGGRVGGASLSNWATRVQEMDRDGIDTQLLLLGAPGVQIFKADEARALATLSNDRATEEAVRKFPGRFALLAAIAPQDPENAARELERAVTKLGAKGAVINGHTKGRYLDEDEFLPIWEAAEALGVPVYIHPREPSPEMLKPYQKYDGLNRGIWGFAAEVSLHSLRMIFAGRFDRFPKLQVVIGHAGENIPFVLDRIDNRYKITSGFRDHKLKRLPSDYFRDNFAVTTSGINWAPTINFMQEVLGPDKVLFAVDYPFEDQPWTVARAEATPMSDQVRKMFFQTNAERVFRLG